MKYKRQIMSGVFALALLTSGTAAFASDVTTTNSKVAEQASQVKMKPFIVKSDLNNKNTKHTTAGKKMRKAKGQAKADKQETTPKTVQ